MNAAAGIVSTHAHTIRPAIPHRTADSRCVAPTPTIEPVIVCVVLTGMPKCVAIMIADRAARLRAEAADRTQLRDARAHRVHDAPAAEQRAERDRASTRRSRPSAESSCCRRRRSGAAIPARSRTTPSPTRAAPTMMPIVFCASLPPCEYDSSAELSELRRPEERGRRAAPTLCVEEPEHDHHQRVAGEQSDQRRDHDERQRLDPLRSPRDRREPASRHRRAGVAADQRVRRARWNAEVPRDACSR